MFAVASGFGIILSLTFLVSAFAKLADIPGTRSGLVSLQLPFRQWHGVLAILAPLAELFVAIGVWLPWRSVAAFAAFVGLIMMAAFTVVIARALRFEDAVHCSCFGSLGSPTVGPSTLGRNITLTIVALFAFCFALMAPGLYPGLLLVADPLAALTLTVLLIVAALVALLIMGGTSSADDPANAHTPGRTTPTSAPASAPTPPAGGSTAVSAQNDEVEDDYLRTPIPFAELIDSSGTPTTLRDMAATQAVLLVFLSPGCGACITLMPSIKGWAAELRPTVRVASVFAQELSGIKDDLRHHVEDTYMQDPQSAAGRLFDMQGRPAAVLLGADGLLAGGPVVGSNRITEFVEEIQEQLRGAAAPDAQPAAGDATPASE